MSAATTSADSPLLFNWGPPRSRKAAILTFLGLSVFAHALCFYVFRVVYPPTVALLPPSARVNLISPASEDGRALLRWVDAEDPALTMTTMRPPDSKTFALPKIEHVPSYATWVPQMKDIPPLTPDLSLPSAAPPGPVRMPRPAASPAAIATRKTSVFVSEECRDFGELHTPEVAFTTSLLDAPANLRFRIAVSPLGEIRHCLPLSSSGDATLDAQARTYLTSSRFEHPAADRTQDTWGVATVQWGAEVARAAATPRP